MVIKRDIYLNRLIKRLNNGLIKVITGIRRCGKSFLLFYLFHDYLIASGVRMHDKLERFINLVQKEVSKVSDESMRDTLLDLANYAIMTVMYIDNEIKEVSQQKTINFV